MVDISWILGMRNLPYELVIDRKQQRIDDFKPGYARAIQLKQTRILASVYNNGGNITQSFHS